MHKKSTQKASLKDATDPEPPDSTFSNEKKKTKPVLVSPEAVKSLFHGLDLFQKVAAYDVRLKKASGLVGELKLEVLRSILRRLVRFQHEIDQDLAEKIRQLELTHAFYKKQAPNEDQAEMLGVTALFLSRMDLLRSTWEDIVSEQHEANLLKLETLLPNLEMIQ